MSTTDVVESISEIQSLTEAFKWIITSLVLIIILMGYIIKYLYTQINTQRNQLEAEKKAITDDLYKLSIDNLTVLKDLGSALRGNSVLIKQIPAEIKSSIETQTLIITNKIQEYGRD